MNIEGYILNNYDDGYWSNKDLSSQQEQFSDVPLITLERINVKPTTWLATIMNGPWNENQALSNIGSRSYCIEKLKTALKHNQEIYK